MNGDINLSFLMRRLRLLLCVAAARGCAVPPAHSVQLLWLLSSLYLPASHTEQNSTPDPLYLPGSHSKHDVAFGDEYVPASQSEQLDALDALILPPSHDTQLTWPVDC